MLTKKRILSTSLALLLGIEVFLPMRSFAQELSSGIANYVEMQQAPHSGDIVSFTNNGYQLSKVAYDPTVYGIVTEKPALSLESAAGKSPNSYAVVSSGKAYIRVTTRNGAIKTGDLITTSELAGVGQKATQNGYVVGTALEDYTQTNPNTVGIILASINFGFNTLPTNIRANLLQQLHTAVASPFLSPVNTLRYVLAGICVLLSFIVGIGIFGKVSVMGVEAMGRNPLAGKMIILSIFINVILTLATMSIGIAIAYLILIL